VGKMPVTNSRAGWVTMLLFLNFSLCKARCTWLTAGMQRYTSTNTIMDWVTVV